MGQLEFKSIQEIQENQEFSFVIPSFQRGYRWSKDNVISMLNDILENEEGYLLHSLCLGKKREKEKEYIVIDGQQRLTAISIVLAVINRKSVIRPLQIKIEYKTRESSKEFLDFIFNYKGEIAEKEIREEWKKSEKEINLDFEYMIETYIEVDKEIEKQMYDICRLYEKLMKTKFIWTVLEFDSEEELIDKFAKVNLGKIPLNNAELIKVELLNYRKIDESFSSNPQLVKIENKQHEEIEDKRLKEIENKQHEIVRLWNEIENRLRITDFWAFIPHKEQYTLEKGKIIANRIEYILQFYLFKKNREKNDAKLSCKNDFSGDFALYDCFVQFSKNKKTSSIEIMKEIYFLFKEVEALYYSDGRSVDYMGDKNLYNYISYYFYYNDSKKNGEIGYLKSLQLLDEVLGTKRNEREKLVKEKIKELFLADGNKKDDMNKNGQKEEQEIKDIILNINYKESKREMLNFLLLYNIILISSTQGLGNRYNFLEYKSKIWTAEHIFPQKTGLKLEQNDCNIKKIKGLLSAITANLDENKNIVLKKEYALRYINYVYRKENEIFFMQNGKNDYAMKKCESYPEELKEQGKFCYDRDKIEKLLESDDKYKKEFAKKLDLIIKASELLEKLETYDECKKLLNFKTDMDKKRNCINENKKNFFECPIRLIETLSQESIKKIDLCLVEKIRKEIESYNIKLDLEKEIDEIKSKIEIKMQLDIKEKTNEPEIACFYNNIWEEIKPELDKINNHLYKVCLDNIENLKDSVVDKIINNYYEKTRQEVNDFFEEKFDDLMSDHSIANIALLDSRINGDKKVGNKDFSEKKVAIFNFMKQGWFVPFSSILTFSDVYTKYKDTDKYWLFKSRCHYLNDFIKTIDDFFE